MTETTQAPQSAYERGRDSVPDDRVRQAWQEGDALKRRQIQEQEEVRADSSLSEEGVLQRLEEIEERYAGKVQSAYSRAREAAEKRVHNTYLWSLPAPGHEAGKLDSKESVGIKDATEDLAVQGQADAIRERIAKRKSGPIKPSEDPTRSVLREEFAKALQGTKGDTESRLSYLAACRVAEGSIGLEEALDEFRNERHRRYQMEHAQMVQAARSIPSGVRKQPLFPSKRRNVVGGVHAQTPGIRRGADSPSPFMKPRRHW
jgi:hypothetical protein